MAATHLKRRSALVRIAEARGFTVRDLLYDLYVEQKKTILEIRRELGISSIAYHIKRFGFETPNRPWKRGKGSPSGGWIHKQYGYRYVCVDGREIQEHRYVMEQSLGRRLSPKELVHHINGDILDNRLENLEIHTKSSHTTLHDTAKSRKGQYQPPMREETKRKLSEAALARHRRKISTH